MVMNTTMASEATVTTTTGINSANCNRRVLIVHSTLPYSFSQNVNASTDDLARYFDGVDGARPRARSFSGKARHCIRPSVCNILTDLTLADLNLSDAMAKASSAAAVPQWKLDERHNHPSLMFTAKKKWGETSVGDVVHVGWPGHCVDLEGTEREELPCEAILALTELYSQKACHPVFIPASTAHAAFNGYYRSLLWPLFHYAIKDLTFLDAVNQRDLWTAYEQVNRLFCEAVERVYQPGDLGIPCPLFCDCLLACWGCVRVCSGGHWDATDDASGDASGQAPPRCLPHFLLFGNVSQLRVVSMLSP